ncbi:MAG: hypothetical protein K9W44_00785 [Candidatus Lokiarchaeota archaeon]|nr:hypothetical protein [Candidatus Harpocratesius repetitus]
MIFRDRDYFQDVHGDLYQVLGSIHLSDRVFALEKYHRLEKSEFLTNPSKKNEGLSEFDLIKIQQNVSIPINPLEEVSPHKFRIWIQKDTGDQFYRILPNYSSISAKNNIAENRYASFSTIFQRNMIMVPKKDITIHWIPNQRLHELTDWFEGRLSEQLEKLRTFDSLERECIEVSICISDIFNISLSNIGVTGSLLWKGHHSESDIDLMIYGHENSRKILDFSYQEYSSLDGNDQNAQKIEHSYLRRYNKMEILPIAQKLSLKSGLSMEECFEQILYKPYLFFYRDRKISITFAPSLQNLPKCPLFLPSSHFKSLGMCRIQLKVESDEWGFDYPGLFSVEVKKVLHTSPNLEKIAKQVKRLMVYEHEFIGFYRVGDIIEVKGILQKASKVPDYTNSWDIIDTYQILVGASESFGNEYIRKIKIQKD